MKRIELSDYELRAVAKAAWGWPAHPIDQAGLADTVREVVDAINTLRDDPVGTVRRSETGALAVRIGGCGDEPDDWRVTWNDGICDWRTHRVVKDWEVIYIPEVS